MMPLMRILIMTLMTLGWPQWLVAQQLPSRGDAAERPELIDLAELIAPIRGRYEMPAIGAAVIRQGQLAALGVDGVRKVGDAARVQPDDLWHLGSCTKAMTATLIGRAVAAGHLQWTTTVGAALAGLRDGMHVDARAITIEQLLQHRSGLPAQPKTSQWLELFRFEGTDRQARREVAESMLGEAPEARPGSRFLYSNAGYMIAGAALEQATGKSWQSLMRTELCKPLGMTSVGFGPPGRDLRVEQPWGHLPTPNGPKPMFHDNPPSLGPAGTVHASLRDWAKFVGLHLDGMHAGKELLSAEVLARLHQPNKARYAMGWVVTTRDWASGPVIWHNGSNTMWFAITWIAPELRFAVMVTCNHGEGAKACDEVAAACIRRFGR